MFPLFEFPGCTLYLAFLLSFSDLLALQLRIISRCCCCCCCCCFRYLHVGARLSLLKPRAFPHSLTFTLAGNWEERKVNAVFTEENFTSHHVTSLNYTNCTNINDSLIITITPRILLSSNQHSSIYQQPTKSHIHTSWHPHQIPPTSPTPHQPSPQTHPPAATASVPAPLSASS